MPHIQAAEGAKSSGLIRFNNSNRNSVGALVTERSGLLLLDKPAGVTSFDCIRDLKRIWNRTDLGHGGTLDKFATGLLPVLVGDGLKLVRFFLETYPNLPTYWKTYSGVLEFGKATTTADPEGEITATCELGDLSFDRVQETMLSFVGADYDQLPPKYSAKKISGERASDLMRSGKDVKLDPVPVTIREFKCLGVDGPFVSFRMTCSKGGYVRTLGEDLAKKLGTVAYVKQLRREAVGSFLVADAVSLSDVEARGETAILDFARATAFLPKFPALRAEVDLLRVGQFSGLAMRLANSGFSANVYCAITEDGAPLALLELTSEKRVQFLRSFLR